MTKEKDLSQELLDLKEKAQNAQDKASEYRGQLNQLYDNLKGEFDCDDEEQAQELLDKMDQEYKQLDEQVKTEVERIKNEYGFSQGSEE